MPEIKEGIKRGIKNLVWLSIFRFFYFLGITMLIPFMFALASEPKTMWQTPLSFLIMSGSLIIVGFVGMFWRKKNLGSTLMFVGLITLIPAFISLYITFMGLPLIVAFLENSFLLGPFVDAYIEGIIPRFGMLTVGYFMVGLLFFLLGWRARV